MRKMNCTNGHKMFREEDGLYPDECSDCKAPKSMRELKVLLSRAALMLRRLGDETGLADEIKSAIQ